MEQTGVLLYCFDTEHVSYSKITERCVARIRKHLKLPITVVTNFETFKNFSPMGMVNYKLVENETNNNKLGKPWYNLERHLAYDHSPYQRTLVIDVDYFCFSDKLLKMLESKNDFLVHKDAHDVMFKTDMKFEREAMLDLVWATVLIFNKTPKVRAIFDAVKLVKDNYRHFCALYRISYKNFRNDYAFAIALNQIGGHSDYEIINDSIATVPADARCLKLDERGAVVKWSDKVIEIKDQDLHFLNKDVAHV